MDVYIKWENVPRTPGEAESCCRCPRRRDEATTVGWCTSTHIQTNKKVHNGDGYMKYPK